MAGFVQGPSPYTINLQVSTVHSLGMLNSAQVTPVWQSFPQATWQPPAWNPAYIPGPMKSLASSWEDKLPKIGFATKHEPEQLPFDFA